MITKLTVPATVTRTVTDRLIFELDASGELQLWDATHENKESSVTLVIGKPQKVTYELFGSTYCGLASIQQSEWQLVCRGESSVVLGSVDFPYLGGAVYKVYPQSARTNVIEVVFEKTATGAAITLVVEKGKSAQRVEVPTGTMFSVVLAAFTETYVVPEIGVSAATQQRVSPMPGGGKIVFDPPMTKVPTEIEIGEE